jgi:hypothetical protein
MYGDFTIYLIKVCSPGPATNAERIIAFMGLYSLFAECAAVAASEASREDLYEQAQMCQNGLEAVLSNLGFHIPTTFDYALAMYLAVSAHLFPLVLQCLTLLCFSDPLLLPKGKDICILGLHIQGIPPRPGPRAASPVSSNRSARRP